MLSLEKHISIVCCILIFSCDNPEEPVIEGCITDTACNYNADVTKDDGSCLVNDCAGECGGSDVVDECDVCGGDGIADGACDCDGNVEDCTGECGGGAIDDDDDGICDILQGTVTDIDGNVYETIQIGEQLWMAENLKVTHYNNGDEIPTGLSSGTTPTVLISGTDGEWTNTTEGAYAVYPIDSAYDGNSISETTCGDDCADVYGNLYNWYAVDDDRGVCPEGWSVPSDGEWTDLIVYLDVYAYPDPIEDFQSYIAGGKMKSTGTIEGGDGLWYTYDWEGGPLGDEGTNESGFNGIPSGFRTGSLSRYYFISYFGVFWSSSENNSANAWIRGLSYVGSNVGRNPSNKRSGFSIRCLGD